MTIATVLIAEDDPIQRRVLKRTLEAELPVEVIEVGDGIEALQTIQAHANHIRLVLLDLRMPGLDGMDVLRQLHAQGSKVPCMVLTGSEKLEEAVEAIQLGAVDFIPKPPQRERLVTSVRNALAIRHLTEEVTRLQSQSTPHSTFESLLTTSPGLSTVVKLGQKAASSDIPVLITGESGVGKELVARAIHHGSQRYAKPFIAVNCGALPDNLVESILFGHEKGAFTGASSRSIGKCREADGGVLFLDEVGELKPETQVKLLRLLQQGEIEPVGSSKAVQVDVRVISATNRRLEDMVANNWFREDLYYRLQGLPIHIPSLRDRRGDIGPLAQHLLQRIAEREQQPLLQLSNDALQWLERYGWPGNVRELQHRLHRAVLLADHHTITAEDLSRWVSPQATLSAVTLQDASVGLKDASGQIKPLAQIEHEVITAALVHFENHVGRAAAALGIGQSTLYKHLKRKHD